MQRGAQCDIPSTLLSHWRRHLQGTERLLFSRAGIAFYINIYESLSPRAHRWEAWIEKLSMLSIDIVLLLLFCCPFHIACTWNTAVLYKFAIAVTFQCRGGMQDCQLLIPGFILCSERSIGIDGSLVNNGENDWIGLYSAGDSGWWREHHKNPNMLKIRNWSS